MNNQSKFILSFLLVLFLALLSTAPARSQFTDGSTGLLQMPTADMQDDGTFMFTTNFLNKHALPSSGWNYNTLQYGIYISFWERIEIGYICTIFNGAWDPRPEEEKGYRLTIIRNQDRHFTGRICLFREGEFGLKWIPALTVGVSDPTTGANGGEYITGTDKVSETGNGFFNRYFMVMSKHFCTSWGRIGAHVGYQVNRRKDYPINSPCVGMDWKPIWLQDKGILDYLDVILEYDSRTLNCGVVASIWDNRLEAMFELQNFQWINFGLCYKLRIKK